MLSFSFGIRGIAHSSAVRLAMDFTMPALLTGLLEMEAILVKSVDNCWALKEALLILLSDSYREKDELMITMINSLLFRNSMQNWQDKRSLTLVWIMLRVPWLSSSQPCSTTSTVCLAYTSCEMGEISCATKKKTRMYYIQQTRGGNA